MNCVVLDYASPVTSSCNTRFPQPAKGRQCGFLQESDERGDNIIHARTHIADHSILGPNALSVYRVTAAWATANGVADEVRDVVIPSGSRTETITENSWSAPSASNSPDET